MNIPASLPRCSYMASPEGWAPRVGRGKSTSYRTWRLGVRLDGIWDARFSIRILTTATRRLRDMEHSIELRRARKFLLSVRRVTWAPAMFRRTVGSTLRWSD